ncbi:hypothetical protein RFI_00424, partial [Reticulomyxa filosa]
YFCFLFLRRERTKQKAECANMGETNQITTKRSDLERIQTQYHALCQGLEEREVVYETDYKAWVSIHTSLTNHIKALTDLLKQQKESYERVVMKQNECLDKLQVEHNAIVKAKEAQEREIALLKQQQEEQEQKKEKQLRSEKEEKKQYELELVAIKEKLKLTEEILGTANIAALRSYFDEIKNQVKQREDKWDDIYAQTRSSLETVLAHVNDPSSFDLLTPEQIKLAIQNQRDIIDS